MGLPFKFSPRGSQLMINPVGVMFFIIDTTEDAKIIEVYLRAGSDLAQGQTSVPGVLYGAGHVHFFVDGTEKYLSGSNDQEIQVSVQPGSHLVIIDEVSKCYYVGVRYGSVRYISSDLRNLDIRSPRGSTSAVEKVYSFPDTITVGNFQNMTKGSINLNTLAVNGTRGWQFTDGIPNMFRNSPIVRGSRSKFLNRCVMKEDTPGADTAFTGTNTTP